MQDTMSCVAALLQDIMCLAPRPSCKTYTVWLLNILHACQVLDILHACQLLDILHACRMWHILHACRLLSILHACRMWHILHACRLLNILHACWMWHILHTCRMWHILHACQLLNILHACRLLDILHTPGILTSERPQTPPKRPLLEVDRKDAFGGQIDKRIHDGPGRLQIPGILDSWNPHF